MFSDCLTLAKALVMALFIPGRINRLSKTKRILLSAFAELFPRNNSINMSSNNKTTQSISSFGCLAMTTKKYHYI